jgi:hypothetical protein
VTEQPIAGQRFSKHVPAATNRLGTNTRYYKGRSQRTNSVQGAFPWQQPGNRHFPWLAVDHIRSRRDKNESIPRAGEVEYLHRSPASRRRQRKGKSRIWDSKIWSRVPRDSGPKLIALARTSSNCKRQTRPLVRESAPHQQTRNCLTVIKIWSCEPDGCFIPRQTGRLTVGRNTRRKT